MLIKILDIVRIAGVSFAFFLGYTLGFQDGYHPELQLHIMIPLIIVSIAGISGTEGLLFGKQAAKAKGFEGGRNYQIQSALAMLSLAVTSIIIYFLGWGIKAELSIYFAFLLFFTASAVNHARDAISRKNYKWQNINRPFITLLLIAGTLHPVIQAIKNLQ